MTTVNPQQCRVALLAGGKSTERDISLVSGNGAKAALEEAGFSVTVLDPASLQDIVTLVQGSFDVAFLCLHGKYGEDGAIQGFLEVIGLPYTGSDVCSSAIAMNKALAKEFYRLNGLDTPVSVTLARSEPYTLASVIELVGLPCVVKAMSSGSTIGVYIAKDEEETSAAIKEAFAYDEQVLIETYIAGEEYTVAVLGNDTPTALPVIKIIPKGGFYDYEAKYSAGGSEHLCPAPISDNLTSTLQTQAVCAHKALGCSGVSRSDFIIDESGTAWVLETNTLPGMTATSLLPDAAKAAGMTFAQVCTDLIRYAFERAGKQA